MPSLKAAIFEADGNIPVGWICTECDAAFDFGRMQTNPSSEQIQALNQTFAAHCREKHPDSKPVIGLKDGEEVHQAGAGIVSEATEN